MMESDLSAESSRYTDGQGIVFRPFLFDHSNIVHIYEVI